MKINPYEILNIDKDSTIEEIVSAYYKIIFNEKSTFDDRYKAEKAFGILTNPDYNEEVNKLNGIPVEEETEIKRRVA